MEDVEEACGKQEKDEDEYRRRCVTVRERKRRKKQGGFTREGKCNQPWTHRQNSSRGAETGRKLLSSSDDGAAMLRCKAGFVR